MADAFRSFLSNKWRHHYITAIFKIFLCFWLAGISRIIHHNQLLLTKLGRILPYWTDDVESAAQLQIIEPLTKKTLGQGWVVLVVNTKNSGTFHSFHQEGICVLLVKNRARAARKQLERWHLLFGEYLRSWTTLYLLNLPINVHYRRWT